MSSNTHTQEISRTLQKKLKREKRKAISVANEQKIQKKCPFLGKPNTLLKAMSIFCNIRINILNFLVDSLDFFQLQVLVLIGFVDTDEMFTMLLKKQIRINVSYLCFNSSNNRYETTMEEKEVYISKGENLSDQLDPNEFYLHINNNNNKFISSHHTQRIVFSNKSFINCAQKNYDKNKYTPIKDFNFLDGGLLFSECQNFDVRQTKIAKKVQLL